MNILRSMRGEDMTFSGVGDMRGSFKFTANTGGITVPFGNALKAAGEPRLTLGPSASAETNPSVNIVNLDTSKFLNSVNSAVSEDRMHGLWTQSVSKELLLHLLVERITVESPRHAAGDSCPDFAGARGTHNGNWNAVPGSGGNVVQCEYVNSPPRYKSSQSRKLAFQAFQNFLLVARPQIIEQIVEGKRRTENVSLRNVKRLLEINKTHGDKFVIREDKASKTKKKYYLYKKKQTEIDIWLSRALKDTLDQTDPKPRAKARRPIDCIAPKAATQVYFASKRNNQSPKDRVHDEATSAKCKKFEKENDDDYASKVVIRSPVGMIYYLGELARATENGEHVVTYPRIYIDANPCSAEFNPVPLVELLESPEMRRCQKPIFVLRKGDGPSTLAVDFAGGRYFVPSKVAEDYWIAGQSLRAMAIVRQLFNMQTSREDLPPTKTILSVGG